LHHVQYQRNVIVRVEQRFVATHDDQKRCGAHEGVNAENIIKIFFLQKISKVPKTYIAHPTKFTHSAGAKSTGFSWGIWGIA
jgi:hypothetical protein